VFEITKIPNEEKQKQISEISQKLVILKNEINLAYLEENNLTQFAGGEGANFASENVSDKVGGEQLAQEVSNTNMANSLSSEASASVLSKIVDFFATIFR
jgi:hypothetical protein